MADRLKGIIELGEELTFNHLEHSTHILRKNISNPRVDTRLIDELTLCGWLCWRLLFVVAHWGKNQPPVMLEIIVLQRNHVEMLVI